MRTGLDSALGGAVQGAKWLGLRAAAPVLEPFYGGAASIPLFHRVVAPPSGPRYGWSQLLEASPAQIEASVSLMRRHRYSFVSMDELLPMLAAPRRRNAPKLAAVTFDDGYVDNYTVAHPLLSALDVPFTLYVATAFPDRTMTLWWYLLEDAVRTASYLGFDHGKAYEWRLDGPVSRAQAFIEANAVFAPLGPAEARTLAERVFGQRRVIETTDALCLTWEMICEMARSGRVTIGAHTVDHVRLSTLGLAEAHRQMAESKQRIEDRASVRVKHFSYPFGACGPREREMARNIGFRTAVTARIANVFPAHTKHPYELPRIYAEGGMKQELQLRGAWPALMNRGRRVITLE